MSRSEVKVRSGLGSQFETQSVSRFIEPVLDHSVSGSGNVT